MYVYSMDKITFKEFVERIYNYESDTFSCSGEYLSKKEAKEIAENILHYIINNDIDGVWLKEGLDLIREEKKK